MAHTFGRYAAVFKALSDETRLKIVNMLTVGGEMCGCVILAHLAISQPNLSYHMKALTTCGLVSSYKNGSMTMYLLNEDMVRDMGTFWIGMANGESLGEEDGVPVGNPAAR